MKTIETTQDRHSKKSSLNGNTFHIRVINSRKDIARFTKLAQEFHYMGEGWPAGDTLRMVMVADGEWIALLLWGSACYRLKHRDEWIGWTDQQRAARQKLVVQNRRFVLLTQPGEHPNLASRISEKVIRELPALWLETVNIASKSKTTRKRFARRLSSAQRSSPPLLPRPKKRMGESPDEKEICYYLSSEPFDKRTPEQWLHLV